MAKISKEIRADILINGEVASFVLRRPTNQEINEFEAERNREIIEKSKTSTARAELFDRILTNVIDLEDESGAITVERKDAIPANLKSNIILLKIENEFRFDVKN